MRYWGVKTKEQGPASWNAPLAATPSASNAAADTAAIKDTMFSVGVSRNAAETQHHRSHVCPFSAHRSNGTGALSLTPLLLSQSMARSTTATNHLWFLGSTCACVPHRQRPSRMRLRLVKSSRRAPAAERANRRRKITHMPNPVSYTHLTLPTKA